jgi:23S rRNA pseudouridine1911/1915/1917 synthase
LGGGVGGVETLVVGVGMGGGEGLRLDRYLVERYPEHSRSRLQSLVLGGHILVGGKSVKAGHKLAAGEVIEVRVPEVRAAEAKAEDIPLRILYEDEHLIAIDKPAGLVVHPAAGNWEGTLVNALLHHCGEGGLSGVGGVARPGIVHRLDKDTSGCMVVAKSDVAHRGLVEDFGARRVRKRYLAVVEGRPRVGSPGWIETQIARHPVDRKRMAVVAAPAGKLAVTEWRVMAEVEGASLLDVRIHTGRTHQIRVHCREVLRAPILGDEIYAKPARQAVRVARLMLHAWQLAVVHPVTGEELALKAEVPGEFLLVVGAASPPFEI